MRIPTIKYLTKKIHYPKTIKSKNLFAKSERGDYDVNNSKLVFKEHIQKFEKGKITSLQLFELALRLSIAKWSNTYMENYFSVHGCNDSGKCGLCYLGDYTSNSTYYGLHCETCNMLSFNCFKEHKSLKNMLIKIKEMKMSKEIKKILEKKKRLGVDNEIE